MEFPQIPVPPHRILCRPDRLDPAPPPPRPPLFPLDPAALLLPPRHSLPRCRRPRPRPRPPSLRRPLSSAGFSAAQAAEVLRSLRNRPHLALRYFGRQFCKGVDRLLAPCERGSLSLSRLHSRESSHTYASIFLPPKIPSPVVPGMGIVILELWTSAGAVREEAKGAHSRMAYKSVRGDCDRFPTVWNGWERTSGPGVRHAIRWEMGKGSLRKRREFIRARQRGGRENLYDGICPKRWSIFYTHGSGDNQRATLRFFLWTQRHSFYRHDLHSFAATAHVLARDRLRSAALSLPSDSSPPRAPRSCAASTIAPTSPSSFSFGPSGTPATTTSTPSLPPPAAASPPPPSLSSSPSSVPTTFPPRLPPWPVGLRERGGCDEEQRGKVLVLFSLLITAGILLHISLACQVSRGLM